MTKLSGGHLDGHALLLLMAFHIGALDGERQFERDRCFAHETLVGVAGAATELVIEMGDGQFPSMLRRKRMEYVQQHHGIETAGHGDENSLSTPEKFSLADGLLDALQQVCHGVMLTHRKVGARGLTWATSQAAMIGKTA